MNFTKARTITKKCIAAALMAAVSLTMIGMNKWNVSATTLNDPVAEESTSMASGKKVTWDCIYFGSYPQTEIIDKAENSGTSGKKWEEKGDYKVAPVTYEKLKNATGWDINGDITIDGKKYRRINAKMATHFVEEDDSDDGLNIDANPENYRWKDTSDNAYRYFRYDKIKWRVLNVNGHQAFLLADKVLDAQVYNTQERTAITWEKSTIRSWLNGYGTSENTVGNDYSDNNFINTAFHTEEKDKIETNDVVNADNMTHKTDGGNDTKDKVFLLSEAETYTKTAEDFGFTATRDIRDNARMSKSSTYAKAMGAEASENEDYLGNCWWWLRSPGDVEYDVAGIESHGVVINWGHVADYTPQAGVRPAIKLDLTDSNLWTYAGSVSSDGTKIGEPKQEEEDEQQPTTEQPTTPPPAKNPEDQKPTTGDQKDTESIIKPTQTATAQTKVEKISITAISNKIAAGKKVKLTANISNNADNKSVTWISSNPKIATVDKNGVVTFSKKAAGRTVKITAIANDGSGKKQTFQIKVMRGVVKSITISGNKNVKAGKTLKLKAKVKATKAANKKLLWTSSNPKYATVSASGTVKALKAGKKKSVKITAMATDGSGKKKTVVVKIK